MTPRLFVFALTFTFTACAAWRSVSPVVISDVNTACADITLITQNPIPLAACLTLEEVLALIDACSKALADHRAASFTLRGATYEIPHASLDEQLSMLHKASARLKVERGVK